MEIVKKELTPTVVKLSFGAQLDDAGAGVKGSVELDIENQGLFIETIHNILQDGKQNIVLDMSGITYIDSSGLWALFEGHKKVTQKSLKMVIFGVTKDVRRVLDITKMSSKLTLVESEKEALAHFG